MNTITRLATFGWAGEDPGELVPWALCHGWLYAGFRSGRPGPHCYTMTSAPGPFRMTPAPTFRMT